MPVGSFKHIKGIHLTERKSYSVFLIIDTPTKFGSVGLWHDNALIRVSGWRSSHNHTADLMPAIESLLTQQRMRPRDLKGIAVTLGPGGFGALRASLSVMKGLAFSLNLPAVGVSALEASAYVYSGINKTVCPILNAGQNQVAWAQFKSSSTSLFRKTQDKITSEAEFIRSNSQTTLFCGEGVYSLSTRLRTALGQKAIIMDQFSPLDRLTGAAAIGSKRLLNGESDNLASLQPHYLMSPTITPPRPPQRVRQGTSGKPK